MWSVFNRGSRGLLTNGEEGCCLQRNESLTSNVLVYRVLDRIFPSVFVFNLYANSEILLLRQWRIVR